MRKPPLVPFLVLTILLTPVYSFAAGSFAGGVFVDATCDVLWYVSGSFGAMLTSAALLGGVVGAAMGNFKLATAAVVVAISCYTMSDMVTLYFGDLGCTPAQGGRVGKSAEVMTVPDGRAKEAGAASFESGFRSQNASPSSSSKGDAEEAPAWGNISEE